MRRLPHLKDSRNKKVLLGKFFGKIFALGNHIIRRRNLPLLNPSQDEYERLLALSDDKSIKPSLLEINNNLDTKYKLNKALEDIEKTIQEIGISNQILLQKADIYLRKNKFRQARQILYKVYKDKSSSKTSNTAKQLLIASQSLKQQDDLNKRLLLIKDLHIISKKYCQKIKDIPITGDLHPDFDIIQPIRNEARKARANDLPMLSYELIDRTLQYQSESPWLLLGKALSLEMIGQRKEALGILKNIEKTNTGEKITLAVEEAVTEIKHAPKPELKKLLYFLAKQTKLISQSYAIDSSYLPDKHKINSSTKIKFLVFRKARAEIEQNTNASLDLTNSILDYFPDDLAALLLRGEAYAALGKTDEAINIWLDLVNTKDANISQKASELISQHFSREAKKISKKGSPKEGLSFFFQQHLELGITPTMSEELKNILLELEPLETHLSDPQLEHHHLMLLFNTQMIECLEAHLNERSRLGSSQAPLEPDAISKTDPKAG